MESWTEIKISVDAKDIDRASDIANGSVVLTLIAVATAPCSTDAGDNMTLFIHYLPVANAGADATICGVSVQTWIS